MKGKAAHETDLIWWIVGGLLGVVASSLPVWLAYPADRDIGLLLEYGGIFVGAALLGYLRSDHPWRWGLSCVLFLPLLDAAQKMEGLKAHKRVVTFEALFPVSSIDTYLLLLLTGLAGGFVGAFFSFHSEEEK